MPETGSLIALSTVLAHEGRIRVAAAIIPDVRSAGAAPRAVLEAGLDNAGWDGAQA